jgi:hypothetical protein
MSSPSLTPRASATVDEEKQGVDHEVYGPKIEIKSVEASPDMGADLEVKPAVAAEDDHEYIQGIKLFLVITGVTLACFLMLLDASIITTVCPCPVMIKCLLFTDHLQGHPSNYQ